MKTYEFKTIDTKEMLLVTEGEITWFVQPNSESRRWKEYLRYTEWVEAGNTPEDFWTQSEVDY